MPDPIKTIPVIEEKIAINKEVVETGSILISKHIEETIESVTVPLLHHEHDIEHEAINILIDNIPAVRYEGNTVIFPVVKEVLVKRVLLVEEIRITKRTVETNDEQQFSLRKESVTIERK